MWTRTALKMAGWGAGALIALVVIALVVVSFVDANRYKGFIAEKVETATGRDVELSGDLELTLWSLTPGLSVEGVTVANLPWGSRPQMVTLKRGEVRLALLPLFTGKIVVERLVLIGPDILIETDPTGHGNWVFGAPAPANSPESPVKEPAAATTLGAPPLFDLNEIRVERGRITYRDGASGQATTAEIAQLTLQKVGDGLAFELNGAYSDEPIKIAGAVGALPTLLANEKYPVRLTAQAGGAAMTVAGAVARPREGQGLDLALTLTAPSLAGLSRLAQRELPALGPVAVKARLADTPSRYTLTSLAATVAQSDLSGEVTVALGGARPKVVARLASRQFTVADFMPPYPAPVAAAPLPLGSLRAVDAEVGVRVGALVAAGVTVADVHLTLTLQDGQLSLDPVAATLGGGTLAAAVTLDARTDTARLAARVAVTQLDAGRLLVELQRPDLISGGTTDVALRLTGAGASVPALVEGLRGDLTIALGPTRLPALPATITGGSLRWQRGQDATLALAGTYHAVPIAVTGTLGDLATLMTQDPYPIKLAVRADKATVTVTGAVARPLTGRGLDLTVALTTPSLADLAGLAQRELPALGPIEVTTRLADLPGGYTLTDLVAQVGQSDLAGEVTLALTGARAKVTARLASRRLDLGDLTLPVGAVASAPRAGAQDGAAAAVPRRSSDPLPVAGLRAVDADVAVTVERLVARGVSADRVSLACTLLDGRLSVKSLTAALGGGSLAAEVTLDAGRDTLALATTVDATQVGVGRVLEDLQLLPGLLRGDRTDATLRLAAAGDSVHALAGDLHGSLEVRIAGARLFGSLAIERLFLARPHGGGGDLRLELAGAYHDQPIRVAGVLGGVAPLVANEAYPVRLTAQAGKAAMTVAGAVARPREGQGLDLALTLAVPSLADLSRLARADLPPIGPIELTAKLSEAQGTYLLTGLSTRVGRSDLSGDVALAPGERPKLTARLAARLLDVADFLPPKPAPVAADARDEARAEPAAAQAPGQAKRLFSADPFPLDRLRALDADIRAIVDRLVVQRATVDHAKLELTLRNGRLTVTAAEVELAGGAVAADLSLDASGHTGVLETAVNIKQVEAGRLLTEMQLPDVMRGGVTDVTIRVAGEGESVRALMGGLNGRLLVVMGEATLFNALLERAGTNVLGATLRAINPFSKKEDRTTLLCAVVRVDVKDGFAAADKGIAIETKNMVALGSGTINLKTEELTLVIRPEPRKGVSVGIDLADLVVLGGTLAEPKLETDVVEALKKSAEVGARVAGALATAGLSVAAEAAARGLWHAIKTDHPCVDPSLFPR